MRPLTHGDVVAAAGAVRSLEPEARRREVFRLLERAHAADRFRKRTGRVHCIWGDGSLMGAVLKGGTATKEPPLSDAAHLSAMSSVIDAVLEWRSRAR